MKQLEQAVVYKDSTMRNGMELASSTAVHPDANDRYEAEDIIDEKQQPCSRASNKRKRQVSTTMYLVRWRGKSPSEDSWEPKSNINAQLLAQWKNRGES